MTQSRLLLVLKILRDEKQLEILTVELYPNGHYVNTKKGK